MAPVPIIRMGLPQAKPISCNVLRTSCATNVSPKPMSFTMCFADSNPLIPTSSFCTCGNIRPSVCTQVMTLTTHVISFSLGAAVVGHIILWIQEALS